MALDPTPRTTFLLGAGACVDAGLPTSIGLTEEITKAVDQNFRYGVAPQALHAVIGAMVAHGTGRGSGAFDGINVERVFSAVQMLARRDELEIAPFVSAWNQNLEHLDASRNLPAFWGSNFKKEVQNSQRGERDLERIFSTGVAALAGSRELGPIFTRLESLMIGALGKALSVQDSKLDYLAPLLALQENPSRIATLNYDRSVELLSERAGMSLDTGIQLWDGGYDWSWESSAEVQLLKLHGSLDWYVDHRRDEGARMRGDRVRRAVDMTQDEIRAHSDSLALVFGQGSKLRSEGPFLAMLLEFDRFLLTTERLVIVGYAFGDEHINSAIRRWLNRTERPIVSIINPAISLWGKPYRAPIFYLELTRAMQRQTPPGTPPEGLQLFALPTGPGLKEVVGSGSALAEPFGDVVDPL
jgi:hypothetical protein